MAQGDLVIYLILTPEFGGQRFGPFEGLEARLGSDRDRCHITLPESLGVAREHCKVIRQGPQNMILSPCERTAAVWLWKGDARRAVQVQTPTAVRSGDSFALVTADGPRFVIELGELPPDVQAARSPAAKNKARRRMSPGKFLEAGKSLAIARLFTVGPVSLLARAYYYVISGAIWQPRVLILGAIMIFGYLSSGVSACAAFKFRSDVATVEKQKEDLSAELATVSDMGSNIEDYTYDKLAIKALKSSLVGVSLAKDDPFLSAVKDESKFIVNNIDQYAWLYADDSARANDFSKWRERVEGTKGIDPDTLKLLPYLAATRDRTKGSWNKLKDSSEAIVCGRGPIRLTYRQAKNLGLETVMLDGYYGGDATEVANDDAARNELLAKTAEAAGESVDVAPASGADILVQGSSTCVRAEGDDDRDDMSKLAKMLVAQIGSSAEHVPEAEANFAPLSRLAKLFAADVKEASFVGKKNPIVTFAKGAPSSAVKELPGSTWVINHAAEVVARSMVLPCEAVLSHDKDKMKGVFGELPDPLVCLVLNYRLTRE